MKSDKYLLKGPSVVDRIIEVYGPGMAAE